jgi:hypothetical protein
MTRTLSIGATTCIECYTCYETIEEAIECENLDREEREAEEAELIADQEQAFWEAEDDYLTSLHGVAFER